MELNNDDILTLFDDETDGTNTHLEDIDPDINYYNSLEQHGLCQSKYYDETTFNDKFVHNTNCSQFSMFHLNIRSLPSNYRQLDILLSSLQVEFDVIGLTETWLTKHNKDIFNFENYNHICKTRDIKRGGGVSMYTKKGLQYKLREDLSLFDSNCESIFSEITSNVLGKQNIVCGVIYRPPNTSLHPFLDYIDKVLETIKKEKKICYILGDFNIDLLKQNEHAETSEFLDDDDDDDDERGSITGAARDHGNCLYGTRKWCACELVSSEIGGL